MEILLSPSHQSAFSGTVGNAPIPRVKASSYGVGPGAAVSAAHARRQTVAGRAATAAAGEKTG